MFDLTIFCSISARKYGPAILLSCLLNGCVNYSEGDDREHNIYPPLSQIQQVDDLALVLKQTQSLPENTTLVVFDIDDTLLTATEFFGSDKWYDWQRGRALRPNGELRVTPQEDQVSCLFDTLGMAFEIAITQPTQDDMAELVMGVENDVLILTARSDAYRAATMRELARNKLDFTAKALTPPEIAYHYDINHGGRSAKVSYVDGVFMVRGMDKGVMLLDLLRRAERNYAAVVFVDDKSKNISNMANALKGAGIDFYGFLYTRVEKAVTDDEIIQAQATAQALQHMLVEHFPERASLLEAGQCAY